MRRSDLYHWLITITLLLLIASSLLQLRSFTLKYNISSDIRSLKYNISSDIRSVSSVKVGSVIPDISTNSSTVHPSQSSLIADPVSTSVPKLRLLVVILSAAENCEIRDKIRKYGWLQRKRESVSVQHYFLVGLDLKLDLVEEMEMYKDIVIWPGPESYRNIVHKLAWFLGKLQYTGSAHSYDFLVKLDDDSYLNLYKLEQYLVNVSPNKPWYGGECIFNKIVYRTGKYAVDPYHYPHAHFPTYAAGAGYVLSAELVRRMVAVMWRVPQFAVEDAYMGVVSNITNTAVLCLNGFYHGDWKEYTEVLHSAVLLHKVKSNDIQLISSFFGNVEYE